MLVGRSDLGVVYRDLALPDSDLGPPLALDICLGHVPSGLLELRCCLSRLPQCISSHRCVILIEDLVRLGVTGDPGQPPASAASPAPHAPADVDRRLAVAEFRPIYQRSA
jgi:hypothetical protein